MKRNFTKSLELFNKLASKGIPSGQQVREDTHTHTLCVCPQGLGFMYSMGIGVNSSQAKVR